MSETKKPLGIEFMDLIMEGLEKMPKQSREQIIAELDGLQIGYSDDMSYSELCELLKKTQTEKPEPEEAVDMTGIRCGLSTIQMLHQRVTILERKIGKLERLVKELNA